MCASLGTVEVLCIFIGQFAHHTHYFVKLTCKAVPFEWRPEQEHAQANFKQAVLDSLAIRAIDYDSGTLVILSVNTSYITIGYILSQCNPANSQVRYFSRFGSITLNEREARFSQPKLELYGVYRSLKVWKMYLIGVRNLVVEVDAQHIKGMLRNLDIAPSASINRWIAAILTFHFTLVHVPSACHGPDGLSHRLLQSDESPPAEDNDLDEISVNFLTMHFWAQINLLTAPHHAVASLVNPMVDAPVLVYQDVSRSKKARAFDYYPTVFPAWYNSLVCPLGFTDSQYRASIHFATQFFYTGRRL